VTHILIIEADNDQNITAKLSKGVAIELSENQATFESITVPSCLELPIALAMILELDKYDGYVLLGAALRDAVRENTIRNINQLAIEFGLAIGSAIISTQNEDKDLALSEPKVSDLGKEAARTALYMHKLKEEIMAQIEASFEHDNENFV
jgi:6,7-dimethyl-8-ribityllumazine synthase